MARIAGVNIPTQKRVVIALQYIHGIGPKFAKEICEKVKLPAERRVSQLTDAVWRERCTQTYIDLRGYLMGTG